MTKRLRKFQFEEKMDMTPLIDCVFLLIMFFILTTEITMRQEEVLLPFALEGKVEEDVVAGSAVVLDIPPEDPSEEMPEPVRLGKIMYKGDVYDYKSLVNLLQKEVDYDMAPAPLGRGRAPEPTPDGRGQLSQLLVRIRADKRVRAEYLRTIFMACASVDPRIYKIEISTEQPTQP